MFLCVCECVCACVSVHVLTSEVTDRPTDRPTDSGSITWWLPTSGSFFLLPTRCISKPGQMFVAAGPAPLQLYNSPIYTLTHIHIHSTIVGWYYRFDLVHRISNDAHLVRQQIFFFFFVQQSSSCNLSDSTLGNRLQTEKKQNKTKTWRKSLRGEHSRRGSEQQTGFWQYCINWGWGINWKSLSLPGSPPNFFSRRSVSLVSPVRTKEALSLFTSC